MEPNPQLADLNTMGYSGHNPSSENENTRMRRQISSLKEEVQRLLHVQERLVLERQMRGKKLEEFIAISQHSLGSIVLFLKGCIPQMEYMQNEMSVLKRLYSDMTVETDNTTSSSWFAFAHDQPLIMSGSHPLAQGNGMMEGNEPTVSLSTHDKCLQTPGEASGRQSGKSKAEPEIAPPSSLQADYEQLESIDPELDRDQLMKWAGYEDDATLSY